MKQTASTLLLYLLFVQLYGQGVPKLDKSGQSVFNGRLYVLVEADSNLDLLNRRILEELDVRIIGASSEEILISCPANRDPGRLLSVAGLRNARFRPKILPDQRRRSPDIPVSANDYRVLFMPDQPRHVVMKELLAAGMVITDTSMLHYGQCELRFAGDAERSFEDLEGILWIEPAPGPDEELRYNAMPNHRVNGLHSGAASVTGQGITIGVGDAGKVGPHIDLNQQVDNYSYQNFNQHATHVTGIIAARDNLDPSEGKGIAPDASVVTAYFSDIITSAYAFIDDFDVVVTNNSYGSSSGGCGTFGTYNLNAVLIDRQLFETDSLLHVFAAGNSGRGTCDPYAPGYRTVLGGWQAAKNVLCVGMTDHLDRLTVTSSRGPVNDGRIKPDIVAVGQGVRSTRFPDTYASGGGTSYSAPAVTGIAALLYQKFSELHGRMPKASLVKGVLMNTSDDLGNPGPDYKFGYGRVHAKKALKVIESGQFFEGLMGHNDTSTFELTVEPGTAHLKVMLSWTDPEGLPFAATVLTHDLDMQIEGPDSQRYLPWVLDPSYARLEDQAARARDSINPQEQVSIVNPQPGTYTVHIMGRRVLIADQPFSVNYSFDQAGVKLTYPGAGDKLVPGESEFIRWDASGIATGPYTVHYSTDDTMWSHIATVNDPVRRYVSWNVPDTVTGSVLLRISADGYTDISAVPFTIMQPASGLVAESPCMGYTELRWDSVRGAHGYNIYQHRPDSGDVVIVATTNDTSIILFTGEDAKVRLGVTALAGGGAESRQTRLIQPFEASGACPWQNDVALVALANEIVVRQHTFNSYSDSTYLSVIVVNKGLDTVGRITAGYMLDGQPPVIEEFSLHLLPLDTALLTFTSVEDLSAAGSYRLELWIDGGIGIQASDDSLKVVLKHLVNDPLSLPWSTGFEGLVDTAVTGQYLALPGSDRWDFRSSSAAGRLQTATRSDMRIEGNRSVTIDRAQPGDPSVSYFMGTFNLSSADAAFQDIRMTFSLMHHDPAAVKDSLDHAWIRGSDTDSWIALQSLFDLDVLPGEITEVSTGISQVLRTAGQNFSSSFQVRFGQEATGPAINGTAEDGYTIDNVVIFEVSSDVELGELVSPRKTGCNLTAEQVAIRLVNNSPDTLLAIPVAYAVNNGSPVFDTVQYLPGNADSVFTFVEPADLSAFQVHEIQTWVSFEADTYRENDSLKVEVINTRLISELPYLEDFEYGHGGWVVTGISPTFELGPPAGTSILTRAASGLNAWVTNLDGNHNANEMSYLISPCFDLSGMTTPVLSFALKYQLEPDNDVLWVEYSTDGEVWSKLGEHGTGTNWYNDNSDVWDGTSAIWRVASVEVPVSGTEVQFRFVFTSDLGRESEGVGLDLVHVHEKAAISPLSMNGEVSRSIALSGWTHFDTSGQRIMSFNALGQDPGIVSVVQFADTMQNDGTAYYLGRHWYVVTGTELSGPARIRLYFTDQEAYEMLYELFITGVFTLTDPFQLAAYQYSGPAHDSLLVNNSSGSGQVISGDSVLIVPYDNGYYAELQVEDLSELWVTSPRIAVSDSVVASIVAGSDDIHEYVYNGAVAMYDTLLQGGNEAVAGLRFAGLEIPRGSLIRNAHLELQVHEGASGEGTLLIEGLAYGNLPPFKPANYDLTQRSRTAQYLLWNHGHVPSGTLVRSPSIRHIVQELVDREDWGEGGATGFTVSGSGGITFKSSEYAPGMAPRLVVEYDTLCDSRTRLYVNWAARGTGSGESWINAYTNLQAALDHAWHCDGVAEIWVAAGTYCPALTSRQRSFNIPGGLRLIGGFDGTEVSLADRNPVGNATILSGDIGILSDLTDNSFHVVVVHGNSDTAVIDGFVIRDGHASGPGEESNRGAGISSKGHLYIANSTITACRADGSGGAIYTWDGASVTFSNCTLSLNSAPVIGQSGQSTITVKGKNLIRSND